MDGFSMIALGVSDPTRAREFYVEVFGIAIRSERDDLITFETGPPRLCLYPADALAAFAGRAPAPPGPATVLSWNVVDDDAVDRVVAAAVARGGACARPAGRLPWGGYGACVADPDGHVWEVVHPG